MAAASHHQEIEPEQDNEELFIDENDVLEVADDDGDAPMDEEDDELGDLPTRGDGEEEDDIIYEDNSMQNFATHSGSVFAVSAHPTANLAASGGEDDLGYIWDTESGQEIVKLTGHTDSVTSTAFSHDGELIATGGMDGKVRVWRRRGKDNWKTWEFLTELQGPDEVMVGRCSLHFDQILTPYSGLDGIPRVMSY